MMDHSDHHYFYLDLSSNCRLSLSSFFLEPYIFFLCVIFFLNCLKFCSTKFCFTLLKDNLSQCIILAWQLFPLSTLKIYLIFFSYFFLVAVEKLFLLCRFFLFIINIFFLSLVFCSFKGMYHVQDSCLLSILENYQDLSLQILLLSYYFFLNSSQTCQIFFFYFHNL